MTDRIFHLQKATGYAGSEEFLVKLGRGLSNRNWDCRIGVIEESDVPVDHFKEELEQAGWTVDSIGMDPVVSPSAVWTVRKIIRSFKPDLLHTHLIHGDLIGALASLGRNVPIVSTKHNDDQFKHRMGYRLFAQLLNWKFDHLVAISDHLKRFYRDQLGLTTKRLSRIYYGLNPDQFLGSGPKTPDPPLSIVREDAVTFGMVARLTEQKGHEELLEAFKRVLSDGRNAQLILVGSGPLEDSLKSTVEASHLSDSVHFLGHRSDVPALLPQFDVFVHPSRWEGFGLVFLEAMAAKLPVVATRVSAIPEIVRDGETGLLVEPGNVTGLTNSMKRLIDNPRECHSLGEEGREHLEKTFTVQRMIDQYEELYRTLLRTDQ